MPRFHLIKHLIKGKDIDADVLINEDEISSIQEIPGENFCIIIMHNGTNFIVNESLRKLYNSFGFNFDEIL